MVLLEGVIWLVALSGLGTGIALAATRGDRFRRALGAVLSILAALVTLNLIAISIDFHDADGFIDCWPYCSTLHEVVGWTFWVGTPLVLVLVIAVGLAATFCSLRNKSR